jgi:acyl transferase domain-containing protein/NAD(P)-dependent dehydrogenase (short-subunit alcohol dehydrogenase family)/SAM-dependent methyltransferase/acyl carrier protein
MAETFLDRIAKLPQKKLALLAAELYERSQNGGRTLEPIAITAMACRMPGRCDTPEAFWNFLERGGDAVERYPAARFGVEERAGARVQWGTFLDAVDRFDAGVFGISPKEATQMDPQQRLLLEVCWEAFENSGTPIDALQDNSTGVFIGISGFDYALMTCDSDLQSDVYAATGLANSIAAGRISYVFGLNGPSTAVDTACSASASAIHLACQSLRARECEAALAGGINLVLLPELNDALTSMDAMSPDGRCKPFSADANGFVRGEGCGVIVLRRLSDATLRGDAILGVIRSSAWNQDGKSSGLTAPNGLAQERVIRAALAAADVRPDEISYVEAHGTGTPLGDPIEASALGRVFGTQRRPDGPLLIGSVKSNIGHLEAAAGVAGVIKVLLALQHEQIPRHLHASTLNPRVDWPALDVTVTSNGASWQRGEKPRLAGVSSFGFSGTNVHIVIEEPPLPAQIADDPAAPQAPATILTASAKSRAALLQLAQRYAEALRRPDAPALAEFAAAANVKRAHFGHRLALVAADAADAAAQLKMFSAGDPRARVRSTFASLHRPPAIGFVYGDQPPDDAVLAELGAHHPAFRRAHDDWFQRPDVSSVPAHQVRVRAFQYALSELWRAWGVQAAVTTGAAETIVEIVPKRSEQLVSELATVYLAGARVEWDQLQPGGRTSHVVLPNYPFERERHWAPTSARKRGPADSAGAPALRSRGLDDAVFRIEWTSVSDTPAVSSPAPAPAPAPAAAPAAAPAPAKVLADLLPRINELARSADVAGVRDFQIDAVRFALQTMSAALLALQPGIGAGTQLQQDDLCRALGVVPAHERLLSQIFSHLEQHGIAQRSGETWTIVRELETANLDEEIARLRRLYPSSRPEIDVAARAQELARVLRGELSGVDMLFPEGSHALADALYRETVAAKLLNQLVGEVAEVLARHGRRPLRVLEIGAGTGSTTITVLPKLPAGTEYTFTDVSPAFLAGAKKELHAYSNIRYELLDIENSARVKSLAATPFDIIIAANVLHATRSLRETFDNVRMLLGEGGSLVMLETTGTHAIGDVTLGTIEGWRRHADDDIRIDGPLLSKQRWMDFLSRNGFEAAVLPDEPALGVIGEQQTIIVARAADAGVLQSPRRSNEVVMLHYASEEPAALRIALQGLGCEATAFELTSNGFDLPALRARLVNSRPRSIVFCAPAQEPDPQTVPDLAARLLNDLLTVVQILGGETAQRSDLWVATTNAQAAFGGSVRPASAALWGFGRVMYSEFPNITGHFVDLDAGDPAWERLGASIAQGSELREFALSPRQMRAPRLARTELQPAPQNHALSHEACYIVTGAFGVLGLVTARWLAEGGAGKLLLVGRREPEPAALAAIEEMRGAGADVEIIVADIGSAAGVDRVFERVGASSKPLRGVIHGAAALADAAITQQSRETLAKAFDPKARGAWLLHERTAGLRLDFFALYSSGAALIGSAGQANYASANTFIDALAHYRRSIGLPGVSVNWGLWADTGAAVRRDSLETWTEQGSAMIYPREGMEMFDRILASGESQVAVLPFDWSNVPASYRRIPVLLRDLFAPHAAQAPPEPPSIGERKILLEGLRRATNGDRHAVFVDFIRSRASQLLNLDPQIRIPEDRLLIEFGFDSLVGLELKNDLQEVLSTALPPTLFFDFPTIADLSRYLNLIVDGDESSVHAARPMEQVSF